MTDRFLHFNEHHLLSSAAISCKATYTAPGDHRGSTCYEPAWVATAAQAALGIQRLYFNETRSALSITHSHSLHSLTLTLTHLTALPALTHFRNSYPHSGHF